MYDGEVAMDNHIGHCFPHYAKMMAHAAMSENLCLTNASEVKLWKGSLTAWGAPRTVVASYDFYTGGSECGRARDGSHVFVVLPDHPWPLKMFFRNSCFSVSLNPTRAP